MRNHQRRTAEDFRRAEIYNALTFGLSGLINCVRSLKEETKLIRELREEIRQKSSRRKLAGDGEEKRP